MHELPFDDAGNAAAEVNKDVVETVRSGVHVLCEKMIQGTFNIVRVKLLSDAEQFELAELAGPEAHGDIPVYVSPDLLEAPMEGDDPTSSLVIRLEREGARSPEDPFLGDTLRIFLPVDGEYEYPTPLWDDEQPDELYLEVSDKTDPALHQRYIIQRDEEDLLASDPGLRQRYAIYEYQSAADMPGLQVVHDNTSDTMIYRGMHDRVPVNAEIATKIIRAFANYSIVPQKYVEINPSAEADTSQPA